MRPLVALLSDFGTRDHYVGAVKGAVLSVCPDASVVDILHEVPAHDVAAGAFALAEAYRDFPRGTVFVAVVDPGVGSERRGLALEAGPYHFVGPDNGIFTHVLADDAEVRVHQITNSALFRPDVSSTFHARDIFGPVAGHLANGVPLSEVGPPVEDPVRFPAEPVRRVGPSEWEAKVLHVDHFGNLTTNLRKDELGRILKDAGGDEGDIVVVVEGAVIPVARAYADVPEGEACALLGSSGHLEVAVHRGNAARILGAGRGAPVRIRMAPLPGPEDDGDA
jgi:S-adenosylmethionine hydrolase